MIRQGLQTVVFGLLLVSALMVILIPNEIWPQRWVRYRGYKGKFIGQPVIFIPPSIRQATVPLEFHINMAEGVCRISFIDADGNTIPHSEMGTGYILRDVIAANNQLLLDPGPNNGYYSVGMGLKYHLLSPFLWQCFACGVLISLGTASLFALFLSKQKRARLQSLKSLFSSMQWTILTILTVFSPAILYPVLHESGHALAGIMLGGRIKNILFTSLSGETPHVSFSYLPDGAGPLMNASGVFLPILFAYILFSIWFVIRRSLTIFQQALLLVPTVLLLFPGLFVFDDHLRGIAIQLGCTGESCIFMVKTIPAFFTIVVYAILGWQLWRKARNI